MLTECGKFDVRRHGSPAGVIVVTAVSMDSPTDSELVEAATNGDVAGFGVLIERHRAGMHAVALGLLGWGPDAEDAVQDAIIIALRRLGDLRDPAAAGPWLRAITRNIARMQLRSPNREVAIDMLALDRPNRGPTPEDVVDGHALRDWIWSALNALSEPLQVPVLLRYFSPATSYVQIAAVCGVPVGTVRSRLNEARRRLAVTLQHSADLAHDDAAALTALRRRAAEELLSSAEQGEVRAALTAAAVPDLDLVGPQGQQGHGQTLLAEIMDSDLSAGVQQRVRHVTASRRVTILECELLSPAWDAEHCPPSVLWVITMHDEWMRRVRLFHPGSEASADPVT